MLKVQTLALNARVLEANEEAEHVLILHGLFAASDNLLRLGKYLSDRYTVHLIDLRNHGDSPHAEEMSYPLMAEDVYRYIVERDLGKVFVIGHSMGGKTAMQLALSHPEVLNKLIVGDIAPVRYEPSHQNIIDGLTVLQDTPPLNRKQADEVLGQFVDALEVRQFLIKNLRKQADQQGLSLRFNLDAIKKNYLALIDAPSGDNFDGATLFIAGQNSDYILPEHQKRTLKLFPSAQLKVIPNASHWLHAEKPEVFNALCARFLASV